jgi:thioredoxin reductase/pSer/pThr/pTyr-binding forkhead associated (FHA) protein/ferredoxin
MTDAATRATGAGQPHDLVVVGGGPAGIACALRARELGLDLAVLELDDAMKRIRDYSKDKLILPGFGGGDRMRFPRGGEHVDALRFADIDKDDLVEQYKASLATAGVTVDRGVELTGLEDSGDGALSIVAWDHGARAQRTYAARFVVLALGRGVPRRFDLPGDTDGIHYTLGEPGHFVGAPACVVGGGTSAAEAVIAISRAKAAAADPTAVYWSYRGDRLPRVSKALAETFFAAYTGNGNILYQPLSEPAAIVTGTDRVEYLSIRIDRRTMQGRPLETTHLEFPKERCLACIGEDLPETLLAELGIRMQVGGPNRRKRMVVSAHLESERPGVFLVGDLLSQAYFETDDFAGAPEGFREVRHRGNVKAALRDGVLVAEVLRQRLDGRRTIEVRLEDADEFEPSTTVGAAGTAMVVLASSAGADAADGASDDEEGPILVRLLPGGVEEEEVRLAEHAILTIGREGCDLAFAEDPFLAERHASIVRTDEGWVLRDDGSKSGTFLRVPVTCKRSLEPGDVLRAGRQFLRIGGEPGAFTLTHYDSQGGEIARHRLGLGTVVLGRKAPDLTLDPDDGTLSRRQLAITLEEDGRLLVKDLKSRNGTFLRVRGSVLLEHGDQIRVGKQVLVFGRGVTAALDSGLFSVPEPAAAPPRRAPAVAAAAKGAATVTFAGSSGALPVATGQTVCDVAEAHGVPLVAECHAGICGSDPVRIVAGAENVDGEAEDRERDTLQDICGLEAGECRLACQLRLRGPVEVEIVKD